MSHAVRFLQRMRAITSPYSHLSHSRIPFYGKFEPSRAWMKGVEPALHSGSSRSQWKLYVLKNYVQDFCKSGRKFTAGSIFGASVVFGSVRLWPCIAYAMDGFDVLVDDADELGMSDTEEDPHAILAFSRKLWLPVFLFITVLLNWNHPVILAAKVILCLLSTKPRPLSVYLFVERLRRRSMSQWPLFYKFNPFYAKKVDVEDYVFLCLARVELKDQKFTLIGILGSWWVLPLSSCEGASSIVGSITLKNYSRDGDN